MSQREGDIWDQIIKAIGLADIAQRRALIRRVDNRTLLVHRTPEALDAPYAYRGFSIWHGTLRGKFKQLEEWRKAKGLEWALKYPVEQETPDEARAQARYEWRVATEADLDGNVAFAIHPALVAYDAEAGFRFSESDGGYEMPMMHSHGGRRGTYTYHREDYVTHIQQMLKVYERDLRERLIYVTKRLEQQLGLPAGGVERVARLAIALHDIGKLDVHWQTWAHKYQQAIGEPVEEDVMLAHTHSETEEHRSIARHIRPERPHHAGEGAIAGVQIARQALGDESLSRILVTAIARHHAPKLDAFDAYSLHPAAQLSLAAALEVAGWSSSEAHTLSSQLLMCTPQTALERRMLQQPPTDSILRWFAYFVIVRVLRLADGKSQEE